VADKNNQAALSWYERALSQRRNRVAPGRPIYWQLESKHAETKGAMSGAGIPN